MQNSTAQYIWLIIGLIVIVIGISVGVYGLWTKAVSFIILGLVLGVVGLILIGITRI